MAKVAMLLPFPEMCETARTLVGHYPYIRTMCVEHLPTHAIAARARELERQGCELIIARGVQARIVKESVKIPLVEMQVTTQELGLVILALKQELGLERPQIGLISTKGVVGDTSQFDELFGVRLRRYSLSHQSQQPEFVVRAIEDGCQAVVGGELVCEQAQMRGLPCRFLRSGRESMSRALDAAARVCYAIDLEKHNSAEMAAMLDNAFGGIMQLDPAGIIRRVNRESCSLLEQAPAELLGKRLSEVMPGIAKQVLDDVFVLGKEAYAFVMDIQHRAVVANLAPIRIDDTLEGAILTFHEGQRIIEMDSELRRELYQRGYIAKFSFEKIMNRSKDISAILTLAKRIAKYPAPVLLSGEPGSGKSIIAQCIHNESLARRNAFVSLDCSAWLPENLDNILFGNYCTRKDSPACLAELAQDGTLYLSQVEALPMETQYKLLSLIQGKFFHNGSNRPVAANVRVIAATETNLASRVAQQRFRGDLHYALSALTLELPPLRRRREDILGWVKFYLGEWQQRYNRYVHLTNGACRFLREYDWPGNLEQLNNICERIVLLTEKRNIDESFVRNQLDQSVPQSLEGTESSASFKDQKAAEVAAALCRHAGNRSKAAEELGISKTTLWRYMKKYNIKADFSC